MLLPRVDVMVTNGGYGAVQRALAAGVPIVAAGRTEDKPEVAARVQHFGVGDRSAHRDADGDRGAVALCGTSWATRRIRAQARRLQSAYAARDSVAEIAALIDEVIGTRAPALPEMH